VRISALIVGGVIAGLVIILGELPLNLWLLANDWLEVGVRLSLPQPGATVAAQAIIKLLLLGVFTVWLAQMLRASNQWHASLLAGGIVWFLVWAWVQWGMLLAGYVTPRIAIITVIWGFIELPLATWLGTLVCDRMAGKALVKPASVA
jgi:hypothetical protein